jgi:hypothetical protein
MMALRIAFFVLLDCGLVFLLFSMASTPAAERIDDWWMD